MSDAVSDIGTVGELATGDAPALFVESEEHETGMAYDPTGRMPIIVMLVWISALLGLGAYLVAFYFPDLAAWGKP